MYLPRPLEVSPFGADDELAKLGAYQQTTYLRRYLEDLDAATIVAEPYYFDRDYLAELAAFYSLSARGYPNVCRRLHFFSERFARREVERAQANDDAAVRRLRSSYLGFIVVRPIPASPLGRTVLRWYRDREAATAPRITTPSRDYDCYLGGLKLTVQGLAWQQQDSAVGTCATVALWSMLHSSALAGYHALPTTAQVTQAAHRTAGGGRRVFPNAGLDVEQLCEAIKEFGLSPVVVPGDCARDGGHAFSRERFAASCTAMLRSGFPVLLLGELDGTAHATCAVGFRSTTPPIAPQGKVVHHDADVPFIYIHDDNLGPSVRFAVASNAAGIASLSPAAPPRVAGTQTPDPTLAYPAFVPSHLVVAVPQELRTSPDALHVAGLEIASKVSTVFQAFQGSLPGLSMTTRFAPLRDYVGRELEQVLRAAPAVLGRARLALIEQVPPMSRHLGIVRIGGGARLLFDVLFDTTDSDAHLPIFAYVVFRAEALPFVEALITHGELPRAYCVDATLARA